MLHPLLIIFHKINWIDIVTIVVLACYAIEGYSVGFIIAFFDSIKFLVSFFLGLKLYGVAGKLIIHFFAIPQGFANAIGFFITSFVIEIILQILFQLSFLPVLTSFLAKKQKVNILNNILGTIPGMFSGAILMTFLLTVITALPLSPFLKGAISSSVVGSRLVSAAQAFEKDAQGAFGEAAHDTLNFFTIEPQTNELVKLQFATDKFSEDQTAEQQMLAMVNNEREKRGIDPVKMDQKLQQLAQEHASDMLKRGYFSHYTPEGLSPFDRMAQDSIAYQYGGENLAFSANVDLAMQGLMQSPGHRENILSPHFGKIGISVLDAGIYGEMFVQEFTD